MLRKICFYLSYYQKPAWDTGISPPELICFIETHRPGKALDIGCGTGTNVITLAKSGWEVTGIDFASRAIRMAKQKAERKGVQVKFLLDDVKHLDSIIESFDLILDIGCFHSLSPKEHLKYINNIDRLLTPDGTFLLYVFFKDQEKVPGPGVTKDDIVSLSQSLRLIHRKDGTERGLRPSAWFSFKKSMGC
jgi:2-polyprenyl-3-methyl-5-hydroxy-6-metoxy-1,4-benzoquinol methylase